MSWYNSKTLEIIEISILLNSKSDKMILSIQLKINYDNIIYKIHNTMLQVFVHINTNLKMNL